MPLSLSLGRRSLAARAWVAVAFAVVASAACDGETAAPPARVTLPLSIAATSPDAIANEHGYRVTLTRAALHIADVHFFAGDVVLGDARTLRRRTRDVRDARDARDAPQRFIDGLLGMPAARAHPGHYTEGDARGEWLDDALVDLLAGEQVLGEIDGVTGHHGSASVGFQNDDSLGGAAILIEGSAEKDGVVVPFHAALAKDEAVEGIDVRAEVDEAGGAMRIEVQLAAFVDKVDFAAVAADGAFAAGTQPFNAFERGCDSTLAYVFRYTENEK